MPSACDGLSGNIRPTFETKLDLPLRRGKVRDVYELPPDNGEPRLLIVATDRVSAFDVVLPTPIPGKGVLLTQIAAWWLRFIEDRGLSRTHLISSDASDVPASAFGPGCTGRDELRARIMIGRRCRVVPIECVVRGYIEGSGWSEYQRTGAICGVPLPAGLRRCDRLPEPIFTPATKAEQGEHDQNITFDRACRTVGPGPMETLRSRSLAIYAAACEHALARGIIIADTKFEFGLPVDGRGQVIDEQPILIDEALTPDSSRFWPADRYEPGRPQPSFDKQFIREHLEALVSAGGWDRQDPGPPLPEAVIEATLEKYRQARDRLID